MLFRRTFVCRRYNVNNVEAIFENTIGSMKSSRNVEGVGCNESMYP
jgi:hypothetical protein